MTHIYMLTENFGPRRHRQEVFTTFEGAKAMALTWHESGGADYPLEWGPADVDSWVARGQRHHIAYTVERFEVMP